MMGLDYPAKVSIGLTYLFLAGGAVASIWKTSVRKNPQTGKSFVKLDLIQLTFPTMSSGALFGVIFSLYEGFSKEFLFISCPYSIFYRTLHLFDL